MSNLSTYTTVNIKGVPVGFPNEITKEKKTYYISYNNTDYGIYGCATTSLCIDDTGQFLILNGSHSKGYDKCGSLEESVAYFYKNIEKANSKSEHGKVFRCDNEGKGGYVRGGY